MQDPHIDDQPEQESTVSSIVNRFLEMFVRAAGIFLLVIGLVLGFLVLKEAWLLYQQPTSIERFVIAIEQGSNLDQVFAPVAEPASSANTAENNKLSPFLLAPAQPAPARAAPVPGGLSDFRLAYFPAWFIAIVLLLLIGRLSITAVKTGGELALYNVLTQKTLKGLMREIRR